MPYSSFTLQENKPVHTSRTGNSLSTPTRDLLVSTPRPPLGTTATLRVANENASRTTASQAANPRNTQCSATIGHPPPALISTRLDARVQVPEEHFEREKPSPVSQVDTFAVDRLSEPSVGIEQPLGQRANENPSPSIPTRPCCIRHTRRNRPNQAGWLGFPQRFIRWKDQEKSYRKTNLDHSGPWTTTGRWKRLAAPPTSSIFACLISVK